MVQIPGGRKFDSMMVNGFLCTKNIAHKKVKAFSLAKVSIVEHFAPAQMQERVLVVKVFTVKVLLLKCNSHLKSDELLYQEPQDSAVEVFH